MLALIGGTLSLAVVAGLYVGWPSRFKLVLLIWSAVCWLTNLAAFLFRVTR